VTTIDLNPFSPEFLEVAKLRYTLQGLR